MSRPENPRQIIHTKPFTAIHYQEGEFPRSDFTAIRLGVGRIVLHPEVFYDDQGLSTIDPNHLKVGVMSAVATHQVDIQHSFGKKSVATVSRHLGRVMTAIGCPRLEAINQAFFAAGYYEKRIGGAPLGLENEETDLVERLAAGFTRSQVATATGKDESDIGNMLTDITERTGHSGIRLISLAAALSGEIDIARFTYVPPERPEPAPAVAVVSSPAPPITAPMPSAPVLSQAAVLRFMNEPGTV